MSVPSATGTAKTTSPAPAKTGAASANQVKQFNAAVKSSTTSNTGSQPPQGQSSQGTSHASPMILAGRPPVNLAPGQGVPLYQSQGAGNAKAPQAAPAKPGKPIDMAQMEAMNRRVQSFNVARSPVDHQRLKDAQTHFQAATDALKAGDYKKAEAELRTLGFPIPAGGGQLSKAAETSAILLGQPVQAQGGGAWQMTPVRMGARGNQAMNDMNGFAANAKMMNRLASAPGGVSNPPTETQATQYMKNLTHPPKGQPQPTAQQVMQASSDITGGMIMHYSSAGRQDPVYNANPTPHAFYKDRAGKTHEFSSVADAQKAAKAARASKSPDAPAGGITRLNARSPDQWSDVTSQGKPRAGRYIGDCESKVYMQTRLLTAAGFKSLGSVDVQHGGGIGHMFGVFKAPDGTTWVTSNEDFRQVKPSNAKVGVTQADLDATLKTMTGEVYKTQNLTGFRFSSAATANLPATGNQAVDSIRHSSELSMMRQTEALIPPPPPPPKPATGSGVPKRP
jgi:hypothetical protein